MIELNLPVNSSYKVTVENIWTTFAVISTVDVNCTDIDRKRDRRRRAVVKLFLLSPIPYPFRRLLRRLVFAGLACVKHRK